MAIDAQYYRRRFRNPARGRTPGWPKWVLGPDSRLVEVLVDRQELSMPPTITAEQVKGFSLFALKAVLSGRGEEILDLAKINLFR